MLWQNKVPYDNVNGKKCLSRLSPDNADGPQEKGSGNEKSRGRFHVQSDKAWRGKT